MAQPPAITSSSRPAPVNPFYNNGSLQPQSSATSATPTNPFDSQPPPYVQTTSQGGAVINSNSSQLRPTSTAANAPPLPPRSRLSPNTTGDEIDRAPSPRRNVPPLPQGGMMHEAPPAPPSRSYTKPQAASPPEPPSKGPPQLPARLNTLVSSVATPERKAQATKTYDRVQEGYGRVVTRERQEMAWRGVQKVGEGVVGLVGKIKGPERK